jgi:hypothetical protein
MFSASVTSVVFPMLTERCVHQADGEECREEDECDMEKFEKVLDKECPSIFVRKVVHSDTRNDRKKKTSRVQNSHHACYYCGKLRSHIQDHMIRRHKAEAEVKNIEVCSDEKMKDKLKDLLRSKGDNVHNKKVCKLKEGELILSRRPTEECKHTDYGPCSACFEWMLTKSLPKHLKTCKGNKEGCIRKKRYLKTMSDIVIIFN